MKKRQGELKLKEWVCIKVDKHSKVLESIQDLQEMGWRLHTYQAIGTSGNPSHYLPV